MAQGHDLRSTVGFFEKKDILLVSSCDLTIVDENCNTVFWYLCLHINRKLSPS